jgi:hypothetical protein
MEDFTQFLVQQGVFIAAGLYVLGSIIKRAPFVPDWLIPWILLICGPIAACLSMEGGFIVENVFQGIFVAGAAVLTNQVWKQTRAQEPGKNYLNNVGYNEPQEGITLNESGNEGSREDDN